MSVLIKSTRAVILNCLGIGFMSMMPLFYTAGYNLVEISQGWILSFLLAYAASQVFGRLAHGNKHSEVHESVSYAFRDWPSIEYGMKYFMFYLYLLCSMLGVSIFAMILGDIVTYLYDIFASETQIVSSAFNIKLCTHSILLLTIFLLNGFLTSQSKKMMHALLSYIKIMITVGVPIIAVINISSWNLDYFLLKIKNLIQWDSIKNIFILKNKNPIIIAFETVFAMSGAESVMMIMDKNTESSTANRAIFLGLFACLMIYMFNTIVCFQTIDLETCVAKDISPYILMLPSSRLIGNMIVNIFMAIMLIGSIYGWFDVIKEMCTNSSELMPITFHKTSDTIRTLTIVLTLFIMILSIELLREFPNFSHHFFSLVNWIIVAVYLTGTLAFFVKKLCGADKI